MALAFQLLDGVIAFVTTEDVQFREGTQVLREAFASAKLKDPNARWDLLFDIRHSNENRSSDELRTIADLIGSHRPILTGRCALVTADPFHFALARMFGSFMESIGLNASVFTSVSEAAVWLRTNPSDGSDRIDNT